MKALINSSSEVNTMMLTFLATKLEQRFTLTNFSMQKKYGLPLEIYSMTLAVFSIQDSLVRV